MYNVALSRYYSEASAKIQSRESIKNVFESKYCKCSFFLSSYGFLVQFFLIESSNSAGVSRETPQQLSQEVT